MSRSSSRVLAFLGAVAVVPSVPILALAQVDAADDIPRSPPFLDPLLACGDSQCLLIWHGEIRENESSRRAVWGQRIDREGQPLDREPFNLSNGDGYGAHVASNGASYLAAYGAIGNIHLALVDRDARVVPTSNRPGSGWFGEAVNAIAGSPHGYLLLTRFASAPTGGVSAQVVSPDGKPVGQGLGLTGDRVCVSDGDGVWTGQHYLTTASTSRGVLTMRIDSTGRALDAEPTPVGVLGPVCLSPRIAAGSTAVLMIVRNGTATSDAPLDAVIMDLDGKNARRLAWPGTTFASSWKGFSLAWSGRYFVVTWIGGASGNELMAARFAADGRLLDQDPLVLSNAHPMAIARQPAVACIGGDCHVFYRDTLYPEVLRRATVKDDPSVLSGGGANATDAVAAPPADASVPEGGPPDAGQAMDAPPSEDLGGSGCSYASPAAGHDQGVLLLAILVLASGGARFARKCLAAEARAPKLATVGEEEERLP